MIDRSPLVALAVLMFCFTCRAEEPLLVAELEARWQMANATAEKLQAESDLAAWRRTQLEGLRDRGHASWQEVAQQDVAARSTAAVSQAATRYAQIVDAWRDRSADLELSVSAKSTEAIGLYMPGTIRIIAWIAAEVAGADLIQQHLSDLQSQHDELQKADAEALEAAIERANRAVTIYSESEDDADLLARAHIRRRLEIAKHKLALAKQNYAVVMARRISPVKQMFEARDTERLPTQLTIPGTRFIDAGSDVKLARLVRESCNANELRAQIDLYQHQQSAVTKRIRALTAIAQQSDNDSGALGKARQQSAQIAEAIAEAKEMLHMQPVASEHQAQSSPPHAPRFIVPKDISDDVCSDAAAVRQMLHLQHLRLQTTASLQATKARGEYLAERTQRVSRIPIEARAPKELDNLYHERTTASKSASLLEARLCSLGSEQQRFCLQIASAQRPHFQLVQLTGGRFVSQQQFQYAGTLLGLIGFVGHTDLYYKIPTAHSYIESREVMECLRRLSFRAPVSRWDVIARTSWKSHDCLTRPLRLRDHCCPGWGLWRSPKNRLGCDDDLRWCYAPYGLRRSHWDFRSLPYDYLGTSVTCGFRDYYPFGTYTFGLSRPSRFSHRNRFPQERTSLLTERHGERHSFPTRNRLYESKF